MLRYSSLPGHRPPGGAELDDLRICAASMDEPDSTKNQVIEHDY
jgi:hypothetical protein